MSDSKISRRGAIILVGCLVVLLVSIVSYVEGELSTQAFASVVETVGEIASNV